jgi:hypothetical protein
MQNLAFVVKLINLIRNITKNPYYIMAKVYHPMSGFFTAIFRLLSMPKVENEEQFKFPSKLVNVF